MKTIVISAVNLNKGGTLTILRDCLSFLSPLAAQGAYRVVAIVHKRELCDFPHIEYIEDTWPKKRWINRLWYEYVTMKKIARQIGTIYLWFSLHDTTPNVTAERRAVYCHNPFPFHRWKWRECLFAPKIVLLSLFSKYVYKKNISKNKYVVVQQEWIRQAFLKMFSLSPGRVIVALPDKPKACAVENIVMNDGVYRFIFAAYHDSHKNFECLVRAAAILYARGISNFQVLVTIKGDENPYAQWLYKLGGHLPVMDFRGFMDKATLYQCYAESDALVFPSKIETWGLPITEFAAFGKPMLLSDLPYAYESAAGAKQVAFFDPEDPEVLAAEMLRLINGDTDFLKEVPVKEITEPVSRNWAELFEMLLEE